MDSRFHQFEDLKVLITVPVDGASMEAGRDVETNVAFERHHQLFFAVRKSNLRSGRGEMAPF